MTDSKFITIFKAKFWPIFNNQYYHDLSLIILRPRDWVANIDNFFISPGFLLNFRKSQPILNSISISSSIFRDEHYV